MSKSESGNVEKCGQNVENVEKNAYLIQKRNKIMHFFLEKSPQNICQLCSKVFSRSDSLKRHLSLCKLNNKQKMELKYPEVSKNVEKKCISQNFKCQFCQNEYKSNRWLSKHPSRERKTLFLIFTLELKNTDIYVVHNINI